MNAVRALLKDRRRSQRGSVLSGVLMMTALVAIVSGALMTELSTNFILSNNLMNKAMNQATVDSAVELALNQFETVPINLGCPDLTPAYASLNARSAALSYLSCWPAYRERTYQPIVSSAAFQVNGTHAVLPTASPPQDLYVVGDTAGNVYQFPFGGSTPNWVYEVPGSVSGAPVTVMDRHPSQNSLDLMTLVPFVPGANPPSGCAATGCVAMLAEDTDASPRRPDIFCYMAARDRVTSSVAMGVNYPTTGFFGDQQGYVFAYSVSEKTLPCPQIAQTGGGGEAVVAGPYVFAGQGSSDVMYVLTSDSVQRYTFNGRTLSQTGILGLPQSGAVGMAVENGSLPARLAISFADGHLAIVRLGSDLSMSVSTNTRLPSTIGSGPIWCHCPNSTNEIGVAGADGSFYLMDTNLSVLGSLAASTWAVAAMPATDSVGEWFVAGSDGYVHELQLVSPNTMAEVTKFGPLGGSASSSLQVGACGVAICIYAALRNGNAYRVPLDARAVTMTACVSTVLPTCSGANPRLWTRMEIGSDGNPDTVHVQGWSYYSG